MRKFAVDKLEGIVLVPLQVGSEGFLALWKGFLPTWSRMVSERAWRQATDVLFFVRLRVITCVQCSRTPIYVCFTHCFCTLAFAGTVVSDFLVGLWGDQSVCRSRKLLVCSSLFFYYCYFLSFQFSSNVLECYYIYTASLFVCMYVYIYIYIYIYVYTYISVCINSVLADWHA